MPDAPPDQPVLPVTETPALVPPQWPGPYAYPPIGAPAPRRSRAGLIVTVVTAVLALGCLGVGTTVFFVIRGLADQTVSAAPANWPTDLPTDSPYPDPTDDPTDSTDDSTDTYVQHVGAITDFMMSRPDNARAWPGVKAAGPLTLATAAVGFSNPGQAKQVLKRHGFKDGYVERWVDAHGNEIAVRVLRFDEPPAGEQVAAIAIADDENSADWGDRQNVEPDPQAAIFVKEAKEKNGYQQSVAIGAFSDMAIIILAEQRSPAQASVPEDVYAQEYTQI